MRAVKNEIIPVDNATYKGFVKISIFLISLLYIALKLIYYFLPILSFEILRASSMVSAVNKVSNIAHTRPEA